MNYPLEPIDCEGNGFGVGDYVIYMRVTDHLLENLPVEEQEAIIAQTGKIFTVIGFNDYGKAELEFDDQRNPESVTYHTIWVEPNCLKKAR